MLVGVDKSVEIIVDASGLLLRLRIEPVLWKSGWGELLGLGTSADLLFIKEVDEFDFN